MCDERNILMYIIYVRRHGACTPRGKSDGTEPILPNQMGAGQGIEETGKACRGGAGDAPGTR